MPRQTKPISPSTLVQQVPIAKIVVPEGRKRALRDITELQASIAAIGLLQPIVLTRKNLLVAGLHRLRACEALGWKAIPAVIVSLSNLTAELAEIDENLCRAELTALERGEQLARRKAIYVALYPQTRAGVAGAAAKHAKERGVSASAGPAFAEQTAAAMGSAMRTVQRDVQIAEKLSAEVRDLLRNSPVADRVEDLVALAQIGDPVQQLELAKVIGSGQAKTLASARALLAEPPASSAEPPGAVYDQLGHPITDPGIAEAFTVIHARTREVLRHLRAAKRAWGHFHDEQVAARRVHIYRSHRSNGYSSLRKILEEDLGFMIYQVKADAPYALCPYCGGAPWNEDRNQACAGCGGVGWGDRLLVQHAPPEMVAALDAKGVREVRAAGGETGEENEDAGITPPELTYGEAESYQEAAAQWRTRQPALKAGTHSQAKTDSAEPGHV